MVNPFGDVEDVVFPGDASGADRSTPSTSRPHPAFYLIIAAMTVALFLPWVLVRIPGSEVREYSLFDFTGGKPMVFFHFLFTSIGILLWIGRTKIGASFTAIAVSFVGWFAVLVSVALGAVRGMIPQIGIGQVDLGRGIIGIGPGAIITIGALLLVAMEALPRSNFGRDRRPALNGFGVLGFLLGLLMALTHTAVWVSGESDRFDAALRLSGDSLFGSFIISGLVWITAIVGVVTALDHTDKTAVTLAALMTFTGLIKFFHALVFLLGKGLINLLLPSSVGDVASVQSHWPLWATLGLSAVCVVMGSTAMFSAGIREKLTRTAALRYLPSSILVAFTVLVIVGQPRAVGQEDTAPSDSTSLVVDSTAPASGTTDTSDSSTNSSVDTPSPVSSSAEVISRSVVYVRMSTPSGTECSSGSGVVIGDGSRILTNDHVVSVILDDDPDCNVISVGITESASEAPTRFLPVTVEASDEELDLAILRLGGGPVSGARPLSIRDETLSIDTRIRVIGYPGLGGETITLSEGVISGIDRRFGDPFYKVSAQMSPGNSGGPVVDEQGRLIGIATAYVPASVECDSKDDCYAAGANLGLVRPIALAQSLLAGR